MPDPQINPMTVNGFPFNRRLLAIFAAQKGYLRYVQIKYLRRTEDH